MLMHARWSIVITHPARPALPPTAPPLQVLEASVRRSNPGVDVAVMLVRGKLGAAATQRLLESGVTVFYVEPLQGISSGTGRASR